MNINLRSNKFISICVVLIGVVLFGACKTETPKDAPQPTIASPTATAHIVEDVAEEQIAEEPEPTSPDIVEDYEHIEVSSGTDVYAQIGFVTWSDGSDVSVEIVEYVGELKPNNELTESKRGLAVSININSGGWAGISHAFSNQTVDKWLPQDWSPYEGISFWVHGNNTGGSLLFEILENRNPDSEIDDAERWNFSFVDDYSGWKQFFVPFATFKRKGIGNMAPNDGLELKEVHGYAFGGFGTIPMLSQTYILDDIRLYGIAPEKPVEFNFDEQNYQGRERGRSKILVKLSEPMDETTSIDFSIAESYATLGYDFIVDTGTLTFPPGETKQVVEIQIVDDEISEGSEQFSMTLHNPVGAMLGAKRRAIFTIRDNDKRDPNIIYDFETVPGLIASAGMKASLEQIQKDDPLSVEEQDGMNTILGLQAVGESSTLEKIYAMPEDWSKHDGIQFWMYGQNSGATLSFQYYMEKNIDFAEERVLVWSDEFEGPENQSPDFFVWQPELGDGKLNGIEGWGNAELEHYTGNPENVSLDGFGNLAITAHKVDPDTTPLQCWYGPCEYTSARLITKDRLEIQYGRIEARIKMPLGTGLWPAFWMLGSDIDEVGWPQSGEIDIVEYLGRKPDTILGTVHGPGYSGASPIGAETALSDSDFSQDFHLFAIDWSPEQIVWTMDDLEYHSVTPAELPDGAEWVFEHPAFIILNLAVGGHYPGNPDKTTPFPAEMLIDYVRVYQKPANYSIISTSFIDDFEGWKLQQVPYSLIAQEYGSEIFSEIWGFTYELKGFAETPLYIDDLGLYDEE